ncbi:predicted protein [Naegleria gruberi]|uniref:Predicted protein n=1 Tax=Naegleria gruberi TaxID=5762 RepID=D2VY83_NAEGR|nr:uncharacterized protein NAEGRDRAFT_74024 [Naegleria gruberi]EFC38205.1 predicted protein [Naegleria gruberi]|eukprot:XP_002670949.1 predicted protein [Naegleria gruberi strain NEG-M]
MNRKPSKISKPSTKLNSNKLSNRSSSSLSSITLISFAKSSTTTSIPNNTHKNNNNTNIENYNNSPLAVSLFNWKKRETKYGTFFSAAPVNSYKRAISNEEMIRVLHLSQIQAAKILDCHLSTLKRRFNKTKHSLGLDAWPQNYQSIRHLPIFKEIYPMNLSFILNKDSK